MNRPDHIKKIIYKLKKHGQHVQFKHLQTFLKNINDDIYYADIYNKRGAKKMKNFNMVDFANDLLTTQAKVQTKLTAGDIEYNDIETSTSDRTDYLGEYMARMGLNTTLYQMLEKHPHLLFKLNDDIIEEVWATVKDADDTSNDPIFSNDMEVVLIWKK